MTERGAIMMMLLLMLGVSGIGCWRWWVKRRVWIYAMSCWCCLLVVLYVDVVGDGLKGECGSMP